MMGSKDDGTILFSVLILCLSMGVVVSVLAVNLLQWNRIVAYRDENRDAYWMARGCAKVALDQLEQGALPPIHDVTKFPDGTVDESETLTNGVYTLTFIANFYNAVNTLQFSYNLQTKTVSNWEDNMVP